MIPVIGAQTHLDATELRAAGSQSILRRLLSEPLGLISAGFFVLVALAGLPRSWLPTIRTSPIFVAPSRNQAQRTSSARMPPDTISYLAFCTAHARAWRPPGWLC